MQKLKINQQKPAHEVWVNETEQHIPYNRTTDFERKAERITAKLAKEAMRLNSSLKAFKTEVKQQAQSLYETFCLENKVTGKGKGKGGATFYNFDRSIKIEVTVNEQISFDENTIELAKNKLDEMLNDGLAAAKDFIKPLVMDAFKTSGGKLDTKRVLGLRRYADRVTDPRYAEAMKLIDKAIRNPKSKEYFRVWVKDDAGQYQDIQLNFSAIEVEG